MLLAVGGEFAARTRSRQQPLGDVEADGAHGHIDTLRQRVDGQPLLSLIHPLIHPLINSLIRVRQYITVALPLSNYQRSVLSLQVAAPLQADIAAHWEHSSAAP